MTISFRCPCGKSLRAKDASAGKRVTCPGCRQPLAVPTAPVLPSDAPAASSSPAAPGANAIAEVAGRYRLSPDDVRAAVLDWVSCAPAYELVEKGRTKRSLRLRDKLSGGLVTILLSQRENRTEVALAFDFPVGSSTDPAQRALLSASVKAVLLCRLEQYERSQTSRIGAAVLLGLGVAAIVANLVLAGLFERFFPVLLAAAPAFLFVGVAGLFQPGLANYMLVDMGLLQGSRGSFSAGVRATSLIVGFTGLALGLVIAFLTWQG